MKTSEIKRHWCLGYWIKNSELVLTTLVKQTRVYPTSDLQDLFLQEENKCPFALI